MLAYTQHSQYIRCRLRYSSPHTHTHTQSRTQSFIDDVCVHVCVCVSVRMGRACVLSPFNNCIHRTGPNCVCVCTLDSNIQSNHWTEGISASACATGFFNNCMRACVVVSSCTFRHTYTHTHMHFPGDPMNCNRDVRDAFMRNLAFNIAPAVTLRLLHMSFHFHSQMCRCV